MSAGKKIILVAGLLFVVLAGNLQFSLPASAASSVLTMFANAKADGCVKGGFFGLEPWYHFIPDSEIGVDAHGDAPADLCGIKCFNILVQGQPNDCGQTASDIPGVILAIIDDLLQVAGIAAVGVIIVGAFQYVGSRGNAERTASAQSTLSAALIGLAISLVAVAFVSYIGSQLT